MKKLFLSILLLTQSCFIFAQNNVVYLHGNTESVHYNYFVDACKRFGITAQSIPHIDAHNSSNLHVIFNILEINSDELPQYYIVYQTENLSRDQLDDDTISKFSNAVCVWDYKRENLNLYNNKVYNYYYFPQNYEYEDPVLLSCLLPLDSLSDYKNILIQSNKFEADISSHLPTLFARCKLNHAQSILELGVSGGQSTLPLSKAAQHLIGVDIHNWSSSYANLKNAHFILMDDLKFPTYYAKKYNNKKLDVIFIDTSHLYQHTFQEIKAYLPLLQNNGVLFFHDSNVTPLDNNTAYLTLNNTKLSAPGNTRGVTKAIKKYFSLSFDEHKYNNFIFEHNGISWRFIHYPFCNGLTVMEKQ